MLPSPPLLTRIAYRIKHRGILNFVAAASRNLWIRISPTRARAFGFIEAVVRTREGFEIGGASRAFDGQGLLPVYPIARRMDNCNFGAATIWEGTLKEGEHFVSTQGRPLGYQYIREATDLNGIADARYDFVCSAYMIQHCANPIKALMEWVRVLKPGGLLVVLIPHWQKTFDHKRPVTTRAHLIDDHRKNTGEDDQTHIPEVLALHDLGRDILAGTAAQFRERTLNNPVNRAVHQHVFDPRLAVELMDYLGLQVCHLELQPVDNIIVVARKLPAGSQPDNAGLLAGANSLAFGQSLVPANGPGAAAS